MVDELNAELREIASNYRFLEALRAEVRHTSRILGRYVASKLAPPGAAAAMAVAAEGDYCADDKGQQQRRAAAAVAGGAEGEGAGEAGLPSIGGLMAASQPKPFPFVVPIVAKSSQLLFDEANRCTRVSRCGW